MPPSSSRTQLKNLHYERFTYHCIQYAQETSNTFCKNKLFWGGIHLQRKLFLIPSKILNLGPWASGIGGGGRGQTQGKFKMKNVWVEFVRW